MEFKNIKDVKDIEILDGQTVINQYLSNGLYGDYMSEVIVNRLDYSNTEVDLSELTLDMIRNENLLFYKRTTSN